MANATPPPRILLVIGDRWPRALLRAALREVGYDASGTRALNGALYQAAPDPKRGPIGLVLLDQDALADEDRGQLEELRRRTGAPIILLASTTRPVRPGPWMSVLRRPVSIGGIVQSVETLLPLAPDARHPID
jgi:hypothetical protein